MIGIRHTKESTLPMSKRNMEKLKADGWKIGNAEDFLGLSKEEAIQIVLEELHHRLPKDNKQGFLPSDKVFQAMALLSEEEE